jgi:hypothetical protein
MFRSGNGGRDRLAVGGGDIAERHGFFGPGGAWGLLRRSSVLAIAALAAACGGDDDASTANANRSDAVAAAETAGSGAPAPSGVAAVGADPLLAVLQVLELDETYRAVLVDDALIADPHELELIGRHYCEGLDVCRTSIWFDAADLPDTLPVREEQMRFAAYGYGRNTHIDYEASQWNCTYFPEFEANRQDCLPRPF